MTAGRNAGARNKEKIPEKPEDGDQQYQNISSAFPDIVHAADDQSDRRQQLDQTKQSKQRDHPDTDPVDGRMKTGQADGQKYEKNHHDERVAQHAPPKFGARRASSPIERSFPKKLKSLC